MKYAKPAIKKADPRAGLFLLVPPLIYGQNTNPNDAVWPGLLTSYAMDAALAGELGDVPDVSAMEEYLAQLEDAEREETYADELQNRSSLTKDEMAAYELEYKGKKLHLNMY